MCIACPECESVVYVFQPKDSFCGEALGDRYVNFDKLIV